MTEPVSQLAFVFPGQGSQSLGMLGELATTHAVVRETFAEASEGAGVDLWTLAQEGPEEQLNRTEFTQPALLAAGIAVWRAWQQRGGARPAMLAGHSLGEYTALVAAGTLSLADGARLVRTRGQLMQEAAPAGTGAMAAILGADDALVIEVCAASSDSDVVSRSACTAPRPTRSIASACARRACIGWRTPSRAPSRRLLWILATSRRARCAWRLPRSYGAARAREVPSDRRPARIWRRRSLVVVMPLFRRRRENEDEPLHPPERGYEWFKEKKPVVGLGQL